MYTGEATHHGVDAAGAAPAGRDDRRRASQVEDFERLRNPPIESDIIPNEEMSKLLEHLKSEELLEAAVGW